jgi:hypothetical protein
VRIIMSRNNKIAYFPNAAGGGMLANGHDN